MNDIRVTVCAIVSTENRYIKEWVEHYLNLGVDTIFLYDNNPINGEKLEDAIGDYIQSKRVCVINVRGINQWYFQYRVYEHFYENYSKFFDWIMYFDADEFLVLNKDKNVKEYLSREMFNGFDMIHVNWRCYGDNNLVRYEDKPLMLRFTKELPKDFSSNIDDGVPEYKHIKSIIRGNLNEKIKFNATPHSPSTKLKCCSSNGVVIENSVSPYFDGNYEYAQLNHYRYKTIEEYVTVKMKRGYPDQPLESALKHMNLDIFFKANGRTPEKELFLKELCQLPLS